MSIFLNQRPNFHWDRFNQILSNKSTVASANNNNKRQEEEIVDWMCVFGDMLAVWWATNVWICLSDLSMGAYTRLPLIVSKELRLVLQYVYISVWQASSNVISPSVMFLSTSIKHLFVSSFERIEKNDKIGLYSMHLLFTVFKFSVKKL